MPKTLTEGDVLVSVPCWEGGVFYPEAKFTFHGWKDEGKRIAVVSREDRKYHQYIGMFKGFEKDLEKMKKTLDKNIKV